MSFRSAGLSCNEQGLNILQPTQMRACVRACTRYGYVRFLHVHILAHLCTKRQHAEHLSHAFHHFV